MTVTLYGKRDFADVINIRFLIRGYSGAQCNHSGPYKREVGRSREELEDI